MNYLDKTGLSHLWSKIKSTFALKKTYTAILTSSGWTLSGEVYVQTVGVSGVTANSIVIVTPDISNGEKYSEYGVMCVYQTSGSLTFNAYLLPGEDLTVNIINLGDS